MKRTALFLVIVFVLAGCHKPDLYKEIVGTWESAGAPASTALPDKARLSGTWSASLDFKSGGRFTWKIDRGDGKSDEWAGTYQVDGYSLSIRLTSLDGKTLDPGDQLTYTLRQQSTGSIRLPLPQDWTGPSVDYFRKD